MKSAWLRATISRRSSAWTSSTRSRSRRSRRSDSTGRRRLAVGWAFQLDRISFRVREVDRATVALGAVAIADWTNSSVVPLQVGDDRFLIERFDAKAEMVEVETACLRGGETSFLRYDKIEHAIPDAKMRHRKLGSVRDMFGAQHVAVKSAHGIDVPDSQNEVVDVANLNLCHCASSR